MPNRRAFLTELAALTSPARFTMPFRLAPPFMKGSDVLALPTAAQRTWQDLEIGMFVHFAPNTWQDKEYDDRSTPLSAITPDVDTEQWAETAQNLGARYVILVAKHVGGFCLWQTNTTDYGIRNTPWRAGKGDVMADLAASCAKRELKLGVYLSPRDDHFGAGLSGRCATPEAQQRYDAIYRQQLTEVLTRYGPITELWLDGSSVVPTGDLVTRYQPSAMVFQGPQATIRWVGTEAGFAPYPCWDTLDGGDARTGIATALHGDPLGDTWMPVEVDVSIRRPNWFWSTTNETNLLSRDALVEIYYRSVGRGAQLLLNLPPDRTGKIPAADAARAKEFGNEIRRRFATSLAETTGRGNRVTLELPGPYRVDHVIIEEDLALGERVRSYRLEGRRGEGGDWVPLGTGISVGHKRIHPVAPATLSAVRLSVLAAAATPAIRRLAVFDTGSPPPGTWQDQVELWADDAVGRWSGGALNLDLTKTVKSAGRYRARLVPDGGGDCGFESLVVESGGETGMSKLGKRPDVAEITISRVGSPMRLRGRVRGAPSGSLLLRLEQGNLSR